MKLALESKDRDHTERALAHLLALLPRNVIVRGNRPTAAAPSASRARRIGVLLPGLGLVGVVSGAAARDANIRDGVGTIELRGVDAGTWGDIRVRIDANPTNGADMPGDYVAIVAGPWTLSHAGQTRRRTVPMTRHLRLLRPEDTAQGVNRGADEPVPGFHSPVTLPGERCRARAPIASRS